MIIDAEAELANMQSIKPQEIKLIQFCQGLKDERLYDKITEAEIWGWEDAKALIRKHTAATFLKVHFEQKTGGSGHVVNSISGSGNKSPSQSPGQRRRHNNEQRGRNRTPQGRGQGRGDRRDSSQGRRSRDSNNIRVCFNCNKISNHFANTCPESKREDGQTEGRITPYPRSREASRDRGGATQESEKPQDQHAQSIMGKGGIERDRKI